MTTTRAVSIVTYNRADYLKEVLNGVFSTIPDGTDVFVCDDGSTDEPYRVIEEYPKVHYYRGPNLGVGANKNRALYLMKNHHYSVILEDDLVPIDKGWFEMYEAVASLTDIHHFCRVQDKQVPESHPSFTEYLNKAMNITPLYASSPRGDLTFLTRKVITTVGGFNSAFKGVGFAHGEWSARVVKAGLISHPLNWIDIREARDKFKQVGDTVGGRWNDDPEEIKRQLQHNETIAKELGETDYIYAPLRLY